MGLVHCHFFDKGAYLDWCHVFHFHFIDTCLTFTGMYSDTRFAVLQPSCHFFVSALLTKRMGLSPAIVRVTQSTCSIPLCLLPDVPKQNLLGIESQTSLRAPSLLRVPCVPQRSDVKSPSTVRRFLFLEPHFQPVKNGWKWWFESISYIKIWFIIQLINNHLPSRSLT